MGFKVSELASLSPIKIQPFKFHAKKYFSSKIGFGVDSNCRSDEYGNPQVDDKVGFENPFLQALSYYYSLKTR